MWATYHDRIFLPVMLGIVGLAWASLIVWGQSPYAGYLHHDGLAEMDVGGEIVRLPLFVSGWTLMTIAMMLPTSLPLIAMFSRVTSARANHRLLVGLLVTGYLIVWTGFGVIAHLLDLGLHRMVERAPIVADHHWLIGSSVLLLAGLYQFTSLKYRCLDACRSPRAFIAARWQGRAERRQAFLLGIEHGRFCVGCCWSLMLLMFLVGAGSLFWMLLLGGVMAIEKNMVWGRQLSQPLGVSLVLGGCSIALLSII